MSIKSYSGFDENFQFCQDNKGLLIDSLVKVHGNILTYGWGEGVVDRGLLRRCFSYIHVGEHV